MTSTNPLRPRVIPAGLKRCPDCGEYRGDHAVVPSYRHDLLEIVSVTCLCHGIRCKTCKKNLIHRPITNFFVEETGRVIHVPWFGQMIPCEKCRARGGFGR